MGKLFQLLYALLLLLAVSAAYTQEKNTTNFDVTKMRSQIDAIRANINELNFVALNQAQEQLSMLENQAELCIKENKHALLQLKALSSNTDLSETSQDTQKATDYLEQKKAQTRSNLSDCKLLAYESHELQKKVTHIIDKTQVSHNFLKTAPLWDIQDKTTLFKTPRYDTKKLYRLSGAQYFTSKNLTVRLTASALFSLIIAYSIYRMFKYFLKKNKQVGKSLKSLGAYFSLILFFLFPYLLVSSQLKHIYPEPLINYFFRSLANYFAVIFFIQVNAIVFSYKKTAVIKNLIRKINTGSILLITVLLVLTFFLFINPGKIEITPHLSGYKVLFLCLLAFLSLWTLRNGLKLSLKYKRLSPLKNNFIEGLSLLFFLGLLTASISGYDAAALFLAGHIIKTVLLTFIMSEIIYLIWHYARILNNKNHPLSMRFHQWVGLKPNKNFIEISILKFLLSLGLLRFFIKFLFMIWEVPIYHLHNVLDFLKNDLYFFNVHIDCISALRGLATFCSIIILGRLLGALLARKNHNFEQKNTRITIITLTNYITFIFAFLISLMVVGVNLTGFALVASALSVGIGFGLKGFASDLISGLILLLSKPLRPGDHIEINNTEGFISKIRLLSTEIKTLSESNVILPNSSLLSQSVTNYTYKNKLTRSTTHIMLKDITDVKRAKAVMLKVAKNHPDIHQEDKKKPEVMVDLRPDRTAMHVVLTLWCIIKDADDRYRINSDINAKVLAAIEKADIPLKL
ncbi:MAG: mechanosensitive ion channel [Legionellaceae bacterium]|nr:mechanosensitive ion channel [Legionellaceae bacterium]